MADEPETTPIQDKYAQQYAADLEANRKKQADVTEQIDGLRQQLEQLRVDEEWLSQAMGTLPAAVAPGESEAGPAAETETPAPAEADADALQSVPQPRQDKDRPVKAAQSKRPAKKAAAKKTAAGKSTAKKAAAKKTTATKKEAVEKAPAEAAPTAEVPAQEPAPKGRTGPPLHELVLAILLKTPGEPFVVREVTDQLAKDHPDRATSVQTVRNTLEILVKKNSVEKSHQQKTVRYTAYGDAGAAPAAGGEGEQVPETAAEKVPAEV